MTGPQSDSILVTHWQQQNVWSKAASQAKSDIGQARVRALLLTTTAAVLSTASAQLGHAGPAAARLLAILAAVALVLVPIVGRPATPKAVRDWTRLRSVSEALKTEVYTYLAGVKPYRGDDRRQQLQGRCEKIPDAQPDLQSYVSGVEPDNRPLPYIHDMASYIELRLDGQIKDYYRPKAGRYRKIAARLHKVEVWLTGLGAVLAVMASFYPRSGLSAWVAVITTIGAAVAAHAAAQRYEYQQIEFARTAQQLDNLRLRYEIGPHDEVADDKFVEECERVISIQNEGWMANLVEDETKG